MRAQHTLFLCRVWSRPAALALALALALLFQTDVSVEQDIKVLVKTNVGLEEETVQFRPGNGFVLDQRRVRPESSPVLV